MMERRFSLLCLALLAIIVASSLCVDNVEATRVEYRHSPGVGFMSMCVRCSFS
jgi:hypothetical protein